MNAIKAQHAFVQEAHPQAVDGRLSRAREGRAKAHPPRFQNAKRQGADYPLCRNPAAIGQTGIDIGVGFVHAADLARSNLLHGGREPDVQSLRKPGCDLVEPQRKEHLRAAEVLALIAIPRRQEARGASVFLLQRAVDQIEHQTPQVCIGALPFRRGLERLHHGNVARAPLCGGKGAAQKGVGWAHVRVNLRSVLRQEDCCIVARRNHPCAALPRQIRQGIVALSVYPACAKVDRQVGPMARCPDAPANPWAGL